MADFTGFYFNNIHSSTFGILRVSDGDRYTQGLLPDFEDYDIEIPKGGSIYTRRSFKKTPIEISIAFDHMTEQQLRDFQKWISEDGLKPLRLDERPYKTYWAKISERPELEYVCFLENVPYSNEKIRIYKGEGQLTFMCYDPIAYCVDETYDFVDGEYIVHEDGINWQDLRVYQKPLLIDDNSTEWGFESGLLAETKGDTIHKKDTTGTTEYYFNLYNPGDKPTDFQLFFDWSKMPDLTGREIFITVAAEGEQEEAQLSISSKGTISSNTSLLDTKKHSLILYKDTISQLRYDLLNITKWPKIPVGKSILSIKWTDELPFIGEEPAIRIKYNYKYY